MIVLTSTGFFDCSANESAKLVTSEVLTSLMEPLASDTSCFGFDFICLSKGVVPLAFVLFSYFFSPPLTFVLFWFPGLQNECTLCIARGQKLDDLWREHLKLVHPKPHGKNSPSWSAIQKAKFMFDINARGRAVYTSMNVIRKHLSCMLGGPSSPGNAVGISNSSHSGVCRSRERE
ncbi:hypothetical protein OROMI_028864 [Orobanche minor]